MFTSWIPLKYHCNGCGECCRHHRIPLTCLDLYRLSQNASFQTADGLNQLECHTHPQPQQGLLLQGTPSQMLLNFASSQQACAYLQDDQLCGIYEARPMACRIFPLDVSPSGHLMLSYEALPMVEAHCDQTPMTQNAQAEYLQLILQNRQEYAQHQTLTQAWNLKVSPHPEQQTLENLLSFIIQALPEMQPQFTSKDEL